MLSHMRSELTTESDLRISSNPRFGTVRAVLMDDDFALTLDDLNSDYREVEEVAWVRHSSGWRFLAYHTDVSPSKAPDRWSGHGWIPLEDGTAYSYVYGRVASHAPVLVEFGNAVVEVEAGSDGWWLFAARAPVGHVDYPVVVT